MLLCVNHHTTSGTACKVVSASYCASNLCQRKVRLSQPVREGDLWQVKKDSLLAS